jgi:hypothetical protein
VGGAVAALQIQSFSGCARNCAGYDVSSLPFAGPGPETQLGGRGTAWLAGNWTVDWPVFCNETDIERTNQDRSIKAAIKSRGGPVR